MKKNEIVKKISGNMNKIGFKLKKHSPEIFIVTGVIGTVASCIIACKATTKVNDILEETKETLDVIHNGAENGEINGKEYTKEDSKKDITIVYFQTGLKFVKLYAPSVILGTLSLASIITSHNIMRKRNLALAAAYTAIDTSFKDYRKRVVERYGKDVDEELRYNIKKEVIEKIEVGEDGKEKKIKEEVSVIDSDLPNDYARWFDRANAKAYEDNHDYNLYILSGAQTLFNNKLIANGYVFLNDVYYELGIPKTKAGQIVGWVYRPDDPDYKGDGYIDFGMKTVLRKTPDGQYEEAILLDFNLDGNILDLM